MPTLSIPCHQLPHVTFPSYEITDEPITDRLTRIFNPKQLKEYLTLYEKAQKHPKQAEKEVQQWRERFEHLPELYNLHSYIYVKRKKLRKAEKLIKLNYLHNPENLFARINYADQCLRKGYVEKVPEIFNYQFDLNTLYPERKTFHFSELLGFTTLVGFYYYALGELETSKDYCAYAKLLDPDDSAVKHLVQKLSRKNLLSHLIHQVQKNFLKKK